MPAFSSVISACNRNTNFITHLRSYKKTYFVSNSIQLYDNCNYKFPLVSSNGH
jgi:hypothetical protein